MPAFNEEKAIGRTVAKLKRLYPEAELLVVDDASTDQTVPVAKAAGAKVIRQPRNRGNGAAIKAGIRKAGDSRLDMALVVCDSVASAAGVFTRNKVRAAPVELSEKRLRRGKSRAVLVNAGVANAMTGRGGMQAARAVTAETARVLGIADSEVVAASTGVIGVQLPVEKMLRAMPALVKNLSPNGFGEFSEAILTTDTTSKIVKSYFRLGARRATILGIAKGSGMIAPDMATMLAFLFTDIAADPKLLRKILKTAAAQTFNRVTVDGDTSTNDTLLLMTSGVLGNVPVGYSSPAAKTLAHAVEDVCYQLAEKIARDGEGATKIARIIVKGASSESDAVKVARTVAESPLVKTALHGADPNWGRVAAAAGRSGAKINQWRLDINIGGIPCVKSGVPSRNFDEKKVAAIMKKDEVEIEINLNLGHGEARYLACDFSAEYVHINAHYRT